eukprot:13475348-Alexandrium_andersonii.AAC.1
MQLLAREKKEGGCRGRWCDGKHREVSTALGDRKGEYQNSEFRPRPGGKRMFCCSVSDSRSTTSFPNDPEVVHDDMKEQPCNSRTRGWRFRGERGGSMFLFHVGH